MKVKGAFIVFRFHFLLSEEYSYFIVLVANSYHHIGHSLLDS